MIKYIVGLYINYCVEKKIKQWKRDYQKWLDEPYQDENGTWQCHTCEEEMLKEVGNVHSDGQTYTCFASLLLKTKAKKRECSKEYLMKKVYGENDDSQT